MTDSYIVVLMCINDLLNIAKCNSIFNFKAFKNVCLILP